MGKSGRSTLVTVAVAIESNPWMVARLTEYVSKSPAMLKSGKEIEKALQMLQSLPQDVSACDTLNELVLSLPTWQSSLRAGACDELLGVLRVKLQSMCLHIKGVKETAMLQKLSQVLHHASLLWPLDTDLQGYVQEVGQVMQAASKGDMLTELQKKCQAFIDADVKDLQAMSTTVHELVTMLASLGTGIADESALNKSHTSAMDGACKQIMTLALHHDPMHEGAWKQILQATEMGFKLAQFNTSTRAKTEEDLTFVSCTLSLVAAMKNLDEAQTATDADMLMYTLALQRARDKIMQTKKSERLASHPCFEKFSVIEQKCADQLSKVKLKQIKGSKASLQQQIDIVSAMAGGTKSGGGHWLDGFAGSTFQSLVEHASQSLLTIDQQEFNGNVQKLFEVIRQYRTNQNQHCPKCICSSGKKAVAYYEKVTGALGTNQQVDFMKVCRATCAKAATTRAAAQLFHVLQSAEDKGQLRTSVQGVLRNMKSLGLTPKDALPPMLYDVVMLCLALRYELPSKAVAT
eukprot:2394970-Amphidinium_carterae.4